MAATTRGGAGQHLGFGPNNAGLKELTITLKVSWSPPREPSSDIDLGICCRNSHMALSQYRCKAFCSGLLHSNISQPTLQNLRLDFNRSHTCILPGYYLDVLVDLPSNGIQLGQNHSWDLWRHHSPLSVYRHRESDHRRRHRLSSDADVVGPANEICKEVGIITHLWPRLFVSPTPSRCASKRFPNKSPCQQYLYNLDSTCYRN